MGEEQRGELTGVELEISKAMAHDRELAVTLGLREYGAAILAYIASVVRDENAAHEVFSVFCEDLWRGIGTFRGEGTFRAWAYRLAWHAAQRYYRDPFAKRAEALPSEAIANIAEEVRTMTAPYLRTVVKDRFAELREKLSPEEQTLLTLRVDRRLSWKEIAQVLGAPGERLDEATLRKRFERAKQRLRKLAAEAGLLDPAG